MKNDRREMAWHPRVKLHLLRKLYLNDALGLRDDELVDEAGFGLLLRCRSIMEFTRACEGSVLCKRCDLEGRETILPRTTMKPGEVLHCPQCGWQITWKVYLAESNRTKGQLIAGHARAAFEDYLKKYPLCKTYPEKMLAIDRLIHEFHRQLGEDGVSSEPMRSASVNLLDGTTSEVLATLDELACGDASSTDVAAQRQSWRAEKVVQRGIKRNS